MQHYAPDADSDAMTKYLYLLKGGTIATFVQKSNEARVFKADVLVEGNTIARIDKDIAPESGVEVIDCQDKWITPGCVDTHRHVFMTVLRGTQCDWLLTEYLVKMAWSLQGTLTPEEVGIGTLAGLLEALHNGVTTILDHFHAAHTPEHADAALKATIESGVRVVWAPARQSPPTRLLPFPEWANDEQAIQWQREKIKEWGALAGGKLRADGRVTLGLAYEIFNWEGTVQKHQEFLAFARANNVQTITAHVVKSPSILGWRDAGLLGPDVVLSHCNALADRPELDDEMWKALKDSGAAIAATPEDELGMAHGNPVAFDALKRGVKCGLGVDCLSINSGDIFTQMRIGLQWARGHDHERIHLNKEKAPFKNKYTCADAFRLGTLGGAETLSLAHLIGTVEVGKRADLLVFDANSVNLGGVEDPIAGVVFHASSEDIEMVFVDGEIVKKDRKLVRDWAPVVRELKQRADDVRKRWPAEVLDERWKQWYETNGAPTI